MGKSSKKAHKYRNRVGRHSKIINECNQAISSDARDICSDLTSSLDERRINACILLANIFMGDKTHTSVHDRIASDDILRKLSLRLVDHNATVRVHAAGAVRNIAASGNITSVTRLCDVGVMGSVVTLVTRELQVISDNNSLLVEQLLEAICNLSAANEEAAAVGVSRASGLIPALLALIDKGLSSFTLLPSVTNTLLVLTDDCSEACQQLTDPVGMAAIMSCLSGGVLAASSLSPAQEARSRLNCAGVVLHMFSCGLLEASAAIVCQAVSVIGAFLDTDAQVVRWAEQSLAPLQYGRCDVNRVGPQASVGSAPNSQPNDVHHGRGRGWGRFRASSDVGCAKAGHRAYDKRRCRCKRFISFWRPAVNCHRYCRNG